MRPKRWRPRSLRGALLLTLLVSEPAGAFPAPQDTTTPSSAVIVPINGTVKMRTSTRKPIRTVDNPRGNIIDTRTVIGDPSSVLLIGRQPGVTRIKLTDTDGNSETHKVVVQADVEYLQVLLRRAVLTANVMPIPISNRSVLLKGTVRRAEDAATITDIVRGLGFRFTDSMRVAPAGDTPYRLTVAMIESCPGKEDSKVVKPGRRVAEAREVKFLHRFPDQSTLRVKASVLEMKAGELSLGLEVESRLAPQNVSVLGGKETTSIAAVCTVAPGTIIRVKIRKAGDPRATCTVDLRVEKLGEKGRPRVHLLDFVSRKFGACKETTTEGSSEAEPGR